MESLNRLQKFGDLIYFYLLCKNMSEADRQMTAYSLRKCLDAGKASYSKRALLALHDKLRIQHRIELKHHDGVELAVFLTKIKKYSKELGVSLPDLTIVVNI